MFGKKKPIPEQAAPEKPTPAFLRDDYPYPAVGDPITDLDLLEPHGVLYEIKCHKCEMAIRSQGCNIKPTYERLMAGNGCIGCGNKELVIKRVDMSKMKENPAE